MMVDFSLLGPKNWNPNGTWGRMDFFSWATKGKYSLEVGAKVPALSRNQR
jgi:hypothetical protein